MVKSYPPFMKFEAFIDRFLDSLELTPLVNKVSLEDVEIGTTEAQPLPRSNHRIFGLVGRSNRSTFEPRRAWI